MMKTYMTKILTVLMLMMFSMGVSADVKIFYGEKGEELKTGETKIKGDNGTIAIEQKASDDGSQTTIYLTFTPENGYTISSDNIEVYAVISTGSGSTRAPEISGDPLGLTEESSKDPEKRYSVKIDSKLGLWIKKAEFQKKDDGSKRSLQEVNFFYLQNQQDTGHYLYPSGDKDSSGNPFAKTEKKQDLPAVWMLIKNGDYYNIRHYSDGKYLVTDDHTVKEKTVKLVEIDDLASYGDKALFVITETIEGSDIYTLMPKGANNDNGYNYLNPIGGVGKNIGLYSSSVKSSQWKMIAVPAKPTFSQADTKVTISKAFGDAWYKLDNKDITTDDSTNPAVNDGTKGTTVNFKYGPKYTIRAISAYENTTYAPTGWWTSEVVSKDFQVKVAVPIISVVGNTVKITGSQSGIKFKYSYVDGVDLKTNGTIYSAPFELADGSRYTVRAIAYNVVEGITYYSEQESSIVVNLRGPEPISSLEDIDDATGSYVFATNFTATGSPKNGIGTSETPFKGTLDGELKTVSRSEPLFECIQDATIKNVILSGVDVSTSGNAGAIACEAKGDSRIYNCGILDGTVSGSTYVGGLVGLLKGTSRVINCFSYANITGGDNVGGIVGYNNETTTSSNLKTMVMNCMFYGDITGGTKVSPVYGGNNIDNLQDKSGLNTFNYYAYEKLKTKKIDSYNCALAVEDRFLNRFEIYRQLLNSNKKLAAWYVTGSVENGDKMAKWVLETADRTITNPKPYPVLKPQGYYPSIINPDIENAPNSTTVGRNHGGKLGKTLNVTIRTEKSDKGGGQSWPSGAEVTTSSLTLTRTDMDGDRFNFNYDKVQLPYYNDIGTGNYTGGRVVTGWKITSITGGTKGTYKAADEWGGYNFADRKCTNKDLTDKESAGSDRVFAQGAYWDVPYGVTAIEIEPYWGYAAFVADERFDYVYKSDYSAKTGISAMGKQVDNWTYNGVSVKTDINSALGTITTKGSTVYDNAIVLVGNFHQNGINNVSPFKDNTPFTIMSVDEDNDHEPDYSLIFHDNNRSKVPAFRFDFLNIPGTAQAQKPRETATVLNASVFNASSWFEITNTCNIYFSQFEYENSSKTAPAPIILLGGVYDQFTSTKVNEVTNTTYLHVGGSAWFKEFNNGTHSDGSKKTKHIPISVTGGDYDGFYLTGTFKPDAAVYNDDAECYVSSGHFKEAAGAGQEKINGSVRWQIYNADIDDFFGGGINSKNPIQGDVTVDIINSYVGTYCGGPKFGNMQSGKAVITNATGCEFGRFFGAGFGGTAITKVKYHDLSTVNFQSWQTLYSTTDRGKYFDGSTTNATYDSGKDYGNKGLGVATDFDYDFFIWTSGTTGGRFYVKFASFSLAQCNTVNSTLKECIINNNFYGGGSLGKVVDNVTSILEDCTVKGNVFGAGFSATLPDIQVRDAGFEPVTNADGTTSYKVPGFNKYSGMFEPGTFSGTTEFTWRNISNAQEDGTTLELTNGKIKNGTSGSNLTKNFIYTDIDLSKSNLGSVDGDVTLTITGTSDKGSVIGTEGDNTTGHVYGGGDESYVTGSGNKITVTLAGNTEVLGNVFGGGNEGLVEGSSEVKILETVPNN